MTKSDLQRMTESRDFFRSATVHLTNIHEYEPRHCMDCRAVEDRLERDEDAPQQSIDFQDDNRLAKDVPR